MDDTIAQFIGDDRLNYIPIIHEPQDYKEMYEKEFFRKQKPIFGAIDAVNKLIASDKFDIYILSVPLAPSPHSYSEKAEWIMEHFPALTKKIILTQDKGMIKGDFLVDDSLSWKEKWEKNGGEFIHIDPRKNTIDQWQKILEYIFSKV